MSAEQFTILGASGFIGSHLEGHLAAAARPYWAPSRDEDVFGRPLGHVIYCIGVTADFRTRPYDAVRAHVCHLAALLENARFASFLYLSTTRIYRSVQSSAEDGALRVNPNHPDDLYDISKIMGESLCLAADRPEIRVARLSNVYGADFASSNFLASVIRDAVGHGHVTLGMTPASEKDYVSVDDVAGVLPEIACSGRHRLYNVASGVNTTNAELLDALQRETGCTVEIADTARTVAFPPIRVERVRDEFGFSPTMVLDALTNLTALYRREVAS